MRKDATIPISAYAVPTRIAVATLRAALTQFGIRYRTIRGTWGELTEIRLADVGAGRGTLEIADRDFSLFHGPDEHTGWSIFSRDEHRVCLSNPIYIAGNGRTVVGCAADSFAAAAAVAGHIAAYQAPVHGPLRPDHVWEECTGPNRHCKKAHRQGRTVHIIPAAFADSSHLVLPTNHYTSEEKARSAVAYARRTAAIITTNEQLYEARRLRQPYRLLPGWIDPTRR
ncbi:hypothetical protein [Streptomyces sp. NPDC097610]|uniref:hypothetical protein n=1 Tax=Streptomyces sp. NPDC097610 TaxID=3157227 RepID=UPI00331D854D